MSEGLLLAGAGIAALIAMAASNDKKKANAPKIANQNKQAEPAKEELTKGQRDALRIKSLMEGGHHAQAVELACKLMTGVIRERSGVVGDGMKLIDTVFSPQKPILKITRHDDHDHLNSHEGYYFMLKGVVGAFRNPIAHQDMELPIKEAQAQIMTIAYLTHIVENHASKAESDVT